MLFAYFAAACKFLRNTYHTERIPDIMLDRLALILVIVGAINWGAIGLFQFDIVAWIFGGQAAIVSRIIYTLVALCGAWCISLLFRRRNTETAQID